MMFSKYSNTQTPIQIISPNNNLSYSSYLYLLIIWLKHSKITHVLVSVPTKSSPLSPGTSSATHSSDSHPSHYAALQLQSRSKLATSCSWADRPHWSISYILLSLPAVLLEVAVHDEHDLLLDLFHLLFVAVLHSEHFEVVVQFAAAQIEFLHYLKYYCVINCK